VKDIEINELIIWIDIKKNPVRYRRKPEHIMIVGNRNYAPDYSV